MIAWLVDAAAIVSQKALLKCSYAPYARIMKKICWEESFHILHGRDVILAMVTGTDEQCELVQEALDRWWEPLMHFHGNPIPAEEDPMVVWRIKSQGNEEARQQFLEGYVPQIRELGLDDPRPEAAQGRGRASGSTPSPTGTSCAPSSPATGRRRQERLAFRRLSREDVAWVERVGARGGRVIFEVFRQERKGSRSSTPARSPRRTRRSPRSTRASSTAAGRSRSRSGSCRARP